MTRQVGQQQFITFVKGLNTEAGPLTFPENSTIEDVNCVLTLKGSHKRRYGIKQEIEGTPLYTGFDFLDYEKFKEWNLNTYTWKAPENVGAKTFLVLQVLDKLVFYDISENKALPLAGTALEVDLSTLIVDEELFKKTGCSFSSGKGKLFVCGKGLDPCFVSYDPDINAVSIKRLELRVRDNIGVDDGLDNNTQPGTLTDEHLYNLVNQGWLYQGSSAITGTNVVATLENCDIPPQQNPFLNQDTSMYYIYVDNLLLWKGTGTQFQIVFLGSSSTPASRHYLTPIYISSGKWSFKVDSGHEEDYLNKTIYVVHEIPTKGNSIYIGNHTIPISRAGTITKISSTGTFSYTDGVNQTNTPYNTYFSAVGRYPSNAQQWFVGREVQQQINVNEVKNFDFGNKRAPRGRCILDPFTENRNQIIPSIPVKPEDKTRIIDTAFMGGRVFYLRQNQLLYSQVIEDIKQAGMCYTEGDPTSEDGFDVVDTDGGVITITDMGDAIALFELQNGLAVFAKNGIWLVTGLSSDEGFKATGYSVRKLSNLECVSKDSIVNVQGTPLFWATSGIYVIAQRDYIGYDVQSLSDTTIQSRFVEIPKHNLNLVKGLYNSGAQRVAWFYDSTKEHDGTERVRETKALIYDVRLQAFYELDMDKEPWHPFLCGAFNTPYLTFISLDEELYDNNNNLIYDDNEELIYTQEAIKNTDLTDVKYLSFEHMQITQGDRLLLDNIWYIRDPEDDVQTDVIHKYAWKDPRTETVMMTMNIDKPTVSFVTDRGNRYYRQPERDSDGKYAWFAEFIPTLTIYTDNEEPQQGDYLYTLDISSERFEYNGAWYNRDTEHDTPNDQYGFYYAWKNQNSSNLIYTAFEEPTTNICRTYQGLTETDRYYEYPAADPSASSYGYTAYHCFAPILHTLYVSGLIQFEVGADLFSKNFFNEFNPTQGTIASINNPNEVDVLTLQGNTKIYGGLSSDYDAGGVHTFHRYGTEVVETYDATGAIPMYRRASSGVYYYAGLSEGYVEFDPNNPGPSDIVYLSSCNFDDISFQDWGSIDFTSTFTTGSNTCGDSFLTKDVIYLTTQLSRTEAVNLQGNVGNESSCLMQMKWNFEDTAFSHKWTTPVQIYRARRLFAPTVDDPNFDDISIRNPVITTKHKVRGDGKALQIKFTSEPGKNFEVLGWNLVVGARD